MSKIEIYTAICGNIDAPRSDIKCFTGHNNFVSPNLNAKIYKVLSHQYIDSDISIWVDGNITLLCSPEELVNEFLGDADIGVFKHPVRNCIYKEEGELKKVQKIKHQLPIIRKQIEYYMSIGYPKNNGLYENGVIVRRHNKIIEEFNNAWWSEISKWSYRDQLSFPVILTKFPELKLKLNTGDVRKHKMFKYTKH